MTDLAYILYLYLKGKYFNEENINVKRTYLISFIWIIAEKACTFDYNFFFNNKVKTEITRIKEEFFKNMNIDEDNELIKIEILKMILFQIKNFNNYYDFEELNFKKEFIKSKSQHDVYLSNLNKVYGNKLAEKEKEFINLSEYDEKLFRRTNEKNIKNDSNSNYRFNFSLKFYEIIDEIINLILQTYEENYKIYSNEINEIVIDERIFIKKFIVNLNKETNNNFDNKCLDNNNNFNNYFNNNYDITQTILNNKNLINNDLNNNQNNFLFKTNPAKINPNINVLMNNNKIEKKEISENNLKQKSFKALKFEDGENDSSDVKEYNSMSLSANIVVNDWLNNLIKNNEKKYNFKPKEEILHFLNEEEQVKIFIYFLFYENHTSYLFFFNFLNIIFGKFLIYLIIKIKKM